MLTNKQKQQIRLLCRQHNRMEAEGMVVRSYHAYHGMDAFVGDEWYDAAIENAINDLFNEKISRLSDQHSETCWSDEPIGPFGLAGEIDGLRSPVDLYSRPVLGCDPRVNGLRTVHPNRLNLAIKVLKGKAREFGHSEILAQKTQNIKFWVKEKAKAYSDARYSIESAIESDDAEEAIKGYTYRRLFFAMDGAKDMDIVGKIVFTAMYNGLEVITIDDEGNIVDEDSIAPLIEEMEEVEEYLSKYYHASTIKETMEQVKADLFQKFLKDGENAHLASFCCPAWAAKEMDTLYEGMDEYQENVHFGYIIYCRKDLDDVSSRIDEIISCVQEYANDFMDEVLPMADKARHLLNEIVEEMEADEELPF